MRSSRRKVLTILWSLLAVVSLFAFTQIASASVVVIGNPKLAIKKLSKKDLAALYMGRASKIKGVRLLPFNQPSNSQAYWQFYQEIMGWSPSQVSGYWSAQVFSGQVTQPNSVDSGLDAIKVVEKNPKAIAYVDTKTLAKAKIDKQVKILYGTYKPPAAASQTPSDKPGSAQAPTDVNPYFHGMQQHARLHDFWGGYQTSSAAAFSQKLQNVAPETTVHVRNPNLDHYLINEMVKNNVTITQAQKQNLWSLIQAQLKLGDAAQNPRVQQWIKYFTDRPKILHVMLTNSVPYIYYVYRQVQEHNMPMRFSLLPMIESGYDPLAYSRVGAVGLWQFMPELAREYRIPMSWWFAGRSDVILSTHAALNFLEMLHKRLGSWDLAAAGYDAGGGAVAGAMERNRRAGRATDYWALRLPQETENYVPKLLAVASIIKDPAKYGVVLPYIPNHPFFTAYKMHSQLDFAQLQQLSGAPIEILHQLNPAMRQWATPPHTSYDLLIPSGDAQSFQTNLAHLSGQAATEWGQYTAHYHESLDDIARRFHTSVKTLQTINSLKTTELRSRQSILVPLGKTETIVAPVQSTPTTADITRLLRQVQAVNHPRQTKLSAPSPAKPQSETLQPIHQPVKNPDNALLPKKSSGTPIDSYGSLKNLVNKIYH